VRLTVFGWMANAVRVPELRRRVPFTAAILAVYRLGSWLPAPGVDPNAVAWQMESQLMARRYEGFLKR
jgi:preprotein translocase subunit SecY